MKRFIAAALCIIFFATGAGCAAGNGNVDATVSDKASPTASKPSTATPGSTETPITSKPAETAAGPSPWAVYQIIDPNDIVGFDFKLYYGVDAKNIIDTYNDKFTKDMVMDPQITVDFKLTDDEMRQILAKMAETNIFAYPGSFKEQSNAFQTPFETYRIEITYKDTQKVVYWKDENGSRSEAAVKLRDLFNMIKVLIYAKDEYKAMPEAKGGYA